MGKGMKDCSWYLGHMIKKAAMPNNLYGENASKIFSGTMGQLSLLPEMPLGSSDHPFVKMLAPARLGWLTILWHLN